MQPSNCLWALDRRGLALATGAKGAPPRRHPVRLMENWSLDDDGNDTTGRLAPRAAGLEKWSQRSVLTRKRDYTSLWVPSCFLRYIPLHVYQKFSWGQNPVNERPLRLRRKGKMLWHLQQRADPSRPRAEKYTIDTSLTNTSVCFVFPCLNAALKPVQLPGSEPKRLFYLHGPVATIKTRSVHVASTCHACDMSCDGMRASAWLSSRPSRAA